MSRTVAIVDAEKAEEEEAMRRQTVGFLNALGRKLKLPQLGIATAFVFYHRFYSSESYTPRLQRYPACSHVRVRVHAARVHLG